MLSGVYLTRQWSNKITHKQCYIYTDSAKVTYKKTATCNLDYKSEQVSKATYKKTICNPHTILNNVPSVLYVFNFSTLHNIGT